MSTTSPLDKRDEERSETLSLGKQHPIPFWIKITALAIALCMVYIYSFVVGSVDISPLAVIDILRSQIMEVAPYWDGVLEQIMVGVRFPQITLSILIGGALSVSGASYQTVFKNPMVSSDILGVSAGAGFGAAFAMLNNCAWWKIQISAFFCGTLAVIAAYLIGTVFGKQNLTVLVLAGVVVSSFFQALISIIKTVADTDSVLPSITFWLMGSLNRGGQPRRAGRSPRHYHIDGAAFHLPSQNRRSRRRRRRSPSHGRQRDPGQRRRHRSIDAYDGVRRLSRGHHRLDRHGRPPHIARAITGASYSKLIASSFLTGGLFLLLIDDVVRTTLSDLPLGVLTVLIGAPVFVFILLKTRKEWI